MNVAAILMVRGVGSTLKNKNAYPILGKPMLRWVLTEAKKARFIDNVFVWSDSDELKKITEDCGCRVIERTKEEVFYHGGFSNPNTWGPKRREFIEMECGRIDISVYLNCNYVLMTADILGSMFCKLMEDPTAKDIWPVARVHGHYFTENPQNRKLFPIWHCQDLDRQDYPPLFVRGSGICIVHEKRQREMVSLQSAYYEVEPKYLLDVHDKEDIELAEFYLSRRKYESV